MARQYDASSNETVKLWSRKLWVEHRKSDALYSSALKGLTGENWKDNAFVEIDEAEKTEGDSIRTTIALQAASSPGTIGNEVLEGKEESITTTTFTFLIDQIRQGFQTGGRMNGQRVTFDTLEVAKGMLRDWWKDRRAVCAINHLCGNTRQTNLRYTGNNAVTAPDTEHFYHVGSGLGAGTDEGVGADSTLMFDLDVIDELVTIGEQLTPPIAPFMIDSQPYYGCLIHGNVAADLRKTSSQWYDVMKAALQGGEARNNPFFNRALGKWRNCLIFVEPHIVRGTHSSTGAVVENTRRNVFFGAGALCTAYGRRQKGAEEQFYWHSGTWDHGDKYYASAAAVMGVDSPHFTIEGTVRSYGKIVFTSYSAERAPIAAAKRDLHQLY
jgi:N4-gp56 family major capsid protein